MQFCLFKQSASDNRLAMEVSCALSERWACRVQCTRIGDWVLAATDSGSHLLPLSEAAFWVQPASRSSLLRPDFVGYEQNQIICIGSDAVAVAAILGATLDRVALAEDILLGFRLCCRTIFSGVQMLPRNCGWKLDNNRVSLVSNNSDPVSEHDEVESVQQIVSEAFSSGDALELTGGIDSRLILALGLNAGVLPKRAVTLGSLTSPDVQVAAKLCEHFRIEHRVIPDPASMVSLSGARAFVRASGYYSNAASYGWLVPVFEGLQSFRRGQITGAGGEGATGFYYSPIDRICGSVDALSLWLRWRVERPRNAFALVFRRDATWDLRRDIEHDAAVVFGQRELSWRQRTDEFYTKERLGHWARPVLVASSSWYRVTAPLMSDAYAAMAMRVPEAGRTSRRFQLDLTRRLSPELAAMPYASELSGTSRLHAVRRTAGAALRRLGAMAGPPDMGANTTAELLATDASTLAAINAMFSSCSHSLQSVGLNAMQRHVRMRWHDIGVLATAAWALEDCNSLARRIRSDQASPNSAIASGVA